MSIKRLRSTRFRVVGLLGLVLALNVGLTLAGLRWLVFPAFERLERNDAVQQLERIEHAIQSEQAHLAEFCRDWAYWDDTYNFVAAPDPHFIRLNLTEDATANTPTDLIALFDPTGQPVFVGIYRGLSERKAATRALLGANGALFRHAVAPLLGNAANGRSASSVLIEFDGAPIIAVAYPLLRSDLSGPAAGVFLMAKRLGDEDLAALQDQTLVPFTLSRADGRARAAAQADTRFQTRSGTAGWVHAISRQQLSLRLRLATADGDGFDIATGYPRRMTQEGFAALSYALVLSTLTFAALVGLIYFRLLAPTFLRPLSAMTASLRRSEGEHNLSAQLPVQGAPELQEVAIAFNTLLRQAEADREEISLLSLTDELTRLPNRRRFEQVLSHEWLAARRQNRSLAVLLCDVDHFKNYNDHYGHPTGDDCLRRIAQAIERSMMRRTDFTARYGGEEFVLILPDTDAHGALTSAERILAAVSSLALPHARSPVAAHVTVSIGVYAATPEAVRKPSEWVALADAALYRAKAGGRNRVELASTGSGLGPV